MKNMIFQWIWYKIVRPLVSVENIGGYVAGRHKRFVWAFRLASLFGGANAVIFGDSEASTFDDYRIMKWFDKITLCFGVPGSIPRTWKTYVTSEGSEVYRKMLKLKQITSMGGNLALLAMMKEAHEQMVEFHELFPASKILIIPPCYETLMGKLIGSKEQWHRDLAKIRWIQTELWEGNYIDTYTVFAVGNTGEPLPGVLADIVHFSYRCVKLILQPVVEGEVE